MFSFIHIYKLVVVPTCFVYKYAIDMLITLSMICKWIQQKRFVHTKGSKQALSYSSLQVLKYL